MKIEKRKARSRALGGALVALVVLLGSAPSARAQSVGFVAAVSGSVEIQTAGSTSWAAAALDGPIRMGDSVKTGQDSFAKILLADDTVLSLGEETEVLIDRIVVGDLATRERSIVQQLKGQILISVGEAFGGPTRLEVHTPTAVVGVKGTIFETRIREETLACNREGQIFVRNIDPSIGGEVLIPQGMCRRVYRGLEPEEPELFPQDFNPVGSGPAVEVADVDLDVADAVLDVTPAVEAGPEVATEVEVELGDEGQEVVFDGGFDALSGSGQLDDIDLGQLDDVDLGQPDDMDLGRLDDMDPEPDQDDLPPTDVFIR